MQQHQQCSDFGCQKAENPRTLHVRHVMSHVTDWGTESSTVCASLALLKIITGVVIGRATDHLVISRSSLLTLFSSDSAVLSKASYACKLIPGRIKPSVLILQICMQLIIKCIIQSRGWPQPGHAWDPLLYIYLTVQAIGWPSHKGTSANYDACRQTKRSTSIPCTLPLNVVSALTHS